MFIAPLIATRRERETHFGVNDRTMVMPVNFVCIVLFPQQKCDNSIILKYNNKKNMVTIAYRNIYYYKKYIIIKCANVEEERENERWLKREKVRDE